MCKFYKLKDFRTQDTLCIHTLRSHDGTWSEQPVHAQVYTCRSQSAGMYRSFLLNESSPCRCPSGSRRWIFTWGQKIARYRVTLSGCTWAAFVSFFNYNYITRFYLGCTPVDRLSSCWGSFLFSLFFGYFIIFLDKITSKVYEVCAVNTFAFDFLCSFIFLFRVVISTNLMN